MMPTGRSLCSLHHPQPPSMLLSLAFAVYRLSVVVVVVFFSCITGFSMVVLVLVLDLLSITSDFSSLEEQPTMVANRTKITRYNGAKKFFLFITGILFR